VHLLRPAVIGQALKTAFDWFFITRRKPALILDLPHHGANFSTENVDN